MLTGRDSATPISHSSIESLFTAGKRKARTDSISTDDFAAHLHQLPVQNQPEPQQAPLAATFSGESAASPSSTKRDSLSKNSIDEGSGTKSVAEESLAEQRLLVESVVTTLMGNGLGLVSLENMTGVDSTMDPLHASTVGIHGDVPSTGFPTGMTSPQDKLADAASVIGQVAPQATADHIEGTPQELTTRCAGEYGMKAETGTPSHEPTERVSMTELNDIDVSSIMHEEQAALEPDTIKSENPKSVSHLRASDLADLGLAKVRRQGDQPLTTGSDVEAHGESELSRLFAARASQTSRESRADGESNFQPSQDNPTNNRVSWPVTPSGAVTSGRELDSPTTDGSSTGKSTLARPDASTQSELSVLRMTEALEERPSHYGIALESPELGRLLLRVHDQRGIRAQLIPGSESTQQVLAPLMEDARRVIAANGVNLTEFHLADHSQSFEQHSHHEDGPQAGWKAAHGSPEPQRNVAAEASTTHRLNLLA